MCVASLCRISFVADDFSHLTQLGRVWFTISSLKTLQWLCAAVRMKPELLPSVVWAFHDEAPAHFSSHVSKSPASHLTPSLRATGSCPLFFPCVPALPVVVWVSVSCPPTSYINLSLGCSSNFTCTEKHWEQCRMGWSPLNTPPEHLG